MIEIENFILTVKKILFYLLSYKYKAIAFKSLIINPLSIEGKKYISLDKNALVKDHTWLLALKIDDHDPILHIGAGSSIGVFNHITSVREVIIGDSVLTANNVYISDNLHGYEDINNPIMNQPVIFKKAVSIGSGSWLGENVCIIGASVGKNCVIGANSVVTKDIPDFSVAVGSPARVIKQFNNKTKSWEQV